jgi:hypothetical protein
VFKPIIFKHLNNSRFSGFAHFGENSLMNLTRQKQLMQTPSIQEGCSSLGFSPQSEHVSIAKA